MQNLIKPTLSNIVSSVVSVDKVDIGQWVFFYCGSFVICRICNKLSNISEQ